MRSSPRVALGAFLAAGFVALQGLRWNEPPGLDQSLFVLYGHWMTHGLRLYRDLWDSKPPGIFALFAVAERLTGPAHAAGLLGAVAAAASGVLCFLLLRPVAGSGAAWCGACLAAFLPSATPFGGPAMAAQAEPLMAPLLLAAALVARRWGARAGCASGLLLGLAATLKIVALFLVAIAWIFAPAAERRRSRRTLSTLAGLSLPPAAWALVLALQGTLGDAVRAVFVFPFAYHATITSRMPLVPALVRGLTPLAHGLPLSLALAAAGVALGWRLSIVRSACVWLGLAVVAIVLERQMAGYHLLLLVPPLALIGGVGAARVAALGTRVWRSCLRNEAAGYAALAALSLAVAVAAGVELRLWPRAYGGHVAFLAGRIDESEFCRRLGGPATAWVEAESIAAAVRQVARPDDALLVWGLAPQVYVRCQRRPATRYAFHQTLLVPESPLSRHWPGADERGAELLRRLRDDPPRFVVVVRHDASGLEPADSESELSRLPALAAELATEYRRLYATRDYSLLVRVSGD